MSETIESYSLAGRDAATLEREERLAKAKRKVSHNSILSVTRESEVDVSFSQKIITFL